MTSTTDKQGKAFKKGETAIHIGSWNGANTFYFQRVKVESCGAKKMTLSSAETGAMLGCDFYPGLGFGSHMIIDWEKACPSDCPRHHVVRSGTFKDMTDEQAEALCLELAASFLAYELKNLKSVVEKHVEQYGEDGYFRSMSKKIAELEAMSPAAFKR